MDGMVDTGASITVIDETFLLSLGFQVHLEESSSRQWSLYSQELREKRGYTYINIRTGPKNKRIKVFVCPHSCCDLILGADFLQIMKATTDMSQRKMRIGWHSIALTTEGC